MASEEKKDLLSRLKAGAVVFDGAMGTALYEKGLLYTRSLDAAVLDRPDLVLDVHNSYVLAGADVIETNTFGANGYRLSAHGLADKMEEINQVATKLARQSAGADGIVAGSVGPTGRLFKTVDQSEYPKIREAFAAQAAVLDAAGVDGLVIETFRHPEELKLVIEGVRAGLERDLPLIACCSFDAFGTMADGTGPEAMAKMLVDWGVAAIGVNCADGPAGVFEMALRMRAAEAPVIAQPNAGLPQRVEGRFAYMATPEYFQLYGRRLFKAGIAGVGGCCGTTPEHIKKIASAARMVGGGAPLEEGGGMRKLRRGTVPPTAPGVSITATREKSKLGAMLETEFVVSVEVNPPPGLSLKKALDGAKLLKEGGVNVINVADGPRASARMGNLALCVRVQQELGMESIMHMTTRDRNVLGMVAHLLAAHELGIRNLVVITGDPPKMGDFPDATPVYDTDSIGLLRLTRGLNLGFDPGGKPMTAGTSFLLATGAEPAAQDYQRELKRLRAKIDGGAELIMTQPVYDPAVLDRFLNDIESFGIPVLVGLLPLASHRNAEFLHNEVPGMRIPDPTRERMRKAGSGDKGRAEGVSIAREMLISVKDRVRGAYIMPPFGRYQLALDVIDGVVR